MRQWVAVLALTGTAGCYAQYVVRPGTIPPEVTQVAPADRVATWNKGIQVFLEEGYVPQVVNEAACVVTGKRRDDLVADALAGSMAILTVSPEGRVRIEVSGAGLYASQDQLVTDVKAEQKRLIDRLTGNAPPAP
jgi:hypothetical protein